MQKNKMPVLILTDGLSSFDSVFTYFTNRFAAKQYFPLIDFVCTLMGGGMGEYSDYIQIQLQTPGKDQRLTYLIYELII